MTANAKRRNLLWPLDLALVLLGGLVLFLVLRLLTFDDPNPIYNAWTYVLGVPTVLIAVSMLTHVFSNETVERSIQVGFLLSVCAHLIMAFAALNWVLFGGFWASDESQVAVVMAKQQSRAPQYYQPPTSATKNSKPDYLKVVETPSEKPTDVHVEIERKNDAAKINLPTPIESEKSRVSERSFEREQPVESTPLPTITSSAEKLDRPQLSTNKPIREANIDIPKLEPTKRAQLPEVNARSTELERPTQRDETVRPSQMSSLSERTKVEASAQIARQAFEKRSLATTLVEKDISESMQRAQSSPSPLKIDALRQTQEPNRTPTQSQVPVPQLNNASKSTLAASAQAREDFTGRSTNDNSSNLAPFSSVLGPKPDIVRQSSAGSRSAAVREPTRGQPQSQDDFLNDARFQPGKPADSNRTSASRMAAPASGSPVPLEGILPAPGSSTRGKENEGNSLSEPTAMFADGKRSNNESRASLSSLEPAATLPDLGKELATSPREDQLTRGLGNRKNEVIVPDLRPSDFAAERFKRPDLAGPKVAASSVPIPTPAFTQRLRRIQELEGEAASQLGPLGPQTELAIEQGLQFLAKYQRPDGSWHLEDFKEPVKMRSPTAATALALLSFQGAGYTHQQFKYEEVCKGALSWFVSQQKPNGDLYVRTDNVSNANAWLYSHSMATLALCEAYGMTQDEAIKDNAQRAVNFLIESQDPVGGGWRYTPRVSSDTSVTGWVMMALKSAELAGLDVRKSVYEGLNRWIENSKATNAPHLYRYNWQANTPTTEHGRVPTPVMTSVGLLIRLYTGWKRDNPNMQKGADWLLENLPREGTRLAPARDTYYWYYATQVIFHMGGDSWRRWHGELYPMLIRSQVSQGEYLGSWEPGGNVPDAWGAFGGRLYVTTLNLLSLEVHYRHLPLYEATAE